jgi:hypothetical protein
MGAVNARTNPLARGFYTVAEAARLIEVGNAPRIRGWLRGYPGREIGPLLYRDYHPVNRAEELSFLDLIEVRFVEHFREQGVKIGTLRRALETAREVFKEEKPLSTDRFIFVPRDDGRDIFVEEVMKPSAKETDDRTLWSLVTKQYEIYTLIRDKLARGVSFDPATHLAKHWVPRPKSFPSIYLDPRIAYGQPVGPHMVPTQTLYESWLAEKEDIGAVADWFDVPIAEAQTGVDFELALRMPATQTAVAA